MVPAWEHRSASPTVQDIGLWGWLVQKAFAALGAIEFVRSTPAPYWRTTS
jgi:hypothetical protein